jgi:predicted choloylglycine hydrolase
LLQKQKEKNEYREQLLNQNNIKIISKMYRTITKSVHNSLQKVVRTSFSSVADISPKLTEEQKNEKPVDFKVNKI